MEGTQMRGTCQHCKRFVRYHTKGKRLCWTCSTTREIHTLYKSDSKHGQRIIDAIAINHKLKPASSPTNHMPGTAAKIAVMRKRVERGEEIFHKLDLTIGND